MKSVELTCWIGEETRNEIKKRFPRCVSRLVRNCLLRALRDKEFFNEMFFWEADDEQES